MAVQKVGARPGFGGNPGVREDGPVHVFLSQRVVVHAVTHFFSFNVFRMGGEHIFKINLIPVCQIDEGNGIVKLKEDGGTTLWGRNARKIIQRMIFRESRAADLKGPEGPGQQRVVPPAYFLYNRFL